MKSPFTRRPANCRVEYTRDLGYGAIDYLRDLIETGDDTIGAMVTIQAGKLVPLDFGALSDPATGRPRVRTVDVNTESYRVAREYMIRLQRKDLEDPEALARIAGAAGIEPEEFRRRYEYVVAEDRFQNSS